MSASNTLPTTYACGLAEEVVRTFGEVRLRVSGTSMAPSILPGDLISVQRATINEISPGEVIVFSRDGRLVVHRVISRTVDTQESTEKGLITRGDRTRRDDPQVLPGEFLGRVISVERSGKKIDLDARSPRWITPLVLLLRASDYATSFYLRIVSLRQALLSRRAAC